MREIPEPDREEWIARLRERARQDADELVPRPGFSVYGLLAPDLGPGALMEAAQVNGVWQQFSLAYGDPLAALSPLASVTTMTTADLTSGPEGPGRPDPDYQQDLVQLIDEERDRIAEQAGVEVEEPAEPPGFAAAELIVDGSAVGCTTCTHGDMWAAQLAVTDLVVLIVGRGVDPGAVRLAAVTDLAPHLHARGERIGRIAERRRQRPEPVLPPAEGVAAYRALVDHVLASSEQLLRSRRAGSARRHRPGDGQLYHALWQRAAREQARIAGCDKWQADEVVTLVVNHLGHLAEEAPWFGADALLREAAIEETLHYSVLGEDVPSVRAQQEWARYWAHHMSARGEEAGEHKAWFEARGEVRSRWLQAWSAWTRTA
jgi:hypothetical protein